MDSLPTARFAVKACVSISALVVLLAVSFVSVDRYLHHDECLQWRAAKPFILNDSYSIETVPSLQNCQVAHTVVLSTGTHFINCSAVKASALSWPPRPINAQQCRYVDGTVCDVYTDVVVAARTFYALSFEEDVPCREEEATSSPIVVPELSNNSRWQCASVASTVSSTTLQHHHYYHYVELLSLLVNGGGGEEHSTPVKACMQHYHQRAMDAKRNMEAQTDVYYWRPDDGNRSSRVISRSAFLKNCTVFETRQTKQLSFVREVARNVLGMMSLLAIALFCYWFIYIAPLG